MLRTLMAPGRSMVVEDPTVLEGDLSRSGIIVFGAEAEGGEGNGFWAAVVAEEDAIIEGH